MWRKDGKQLMYISSDNSTVMSVGIDSGSSFQAGVPQRVFGLPADRLQTTYTGLFNVVPSADLKRFLVPLPVAQPLAPAFTALVNWKPGTNANSR